MNENIPSRDKVIAEMLSTTTVVSMHLGSDLRNMLQTNSVQPKSLDSLERFNQPIIDRMLSTESLVLDFVAELQPSRLGQILASDHRVIDTFNDVLKRLEAYGHEFTRLSNTTDQMRFSAYFRDFVAGLTAAFNPHMDKDACEKGKEPGKSEKAHDLER